MSTTQTVHEQYWPAFYGNIEEITNKNTNYRRVIATTHTMQLVVMSLSPKQEIGLEIHPYTSQFIRVESGLGILKMKDHTYALAEGFAILVPPNTEHNVINTSSNLPLRLYTIYSPPNHPLGKVDVIKS
ncbi:MAG: cupin domain-containing protein [Gemmatimonadales bacterium]